MESEERPPETPSPQQLAEAEEPDEFPIFRISIMGRSSDSLPKELQFDLRSRRKP